ncbi:MAG: hypothetical protein HY826_12245 [Actinobacteria bacterium]|nr:hypothetical protein [Actinomycetota bacterium]
MTATAADTLRTRAAALRSMAVRLRSLRILDCFRWGGADTWVGPSPQRCDEALRAIPGALRAQADTLCTQARQLERLAAELDAQALVAGRH